jgi:hypothetical protein
MDKSFRALLFWTLILSACSTSLPPADTAPLANQVTPGTSANQNCGYQWASKDLPELSSKFMQAIQQIQPDAQANAYAFGEDCVYTDGHADFSAMETDFNITLQVSSITDANECGEWVVKIMQVIADIPKEELVGPRPGKVSLRLQTKTEQKNLNFYIERYQSLQTGLSNTEICQRLQQGPP